MEDHYKTEGPAKVEFRATSIPGELIRLEMSGTYVTSTSAILDHQEFKSLVKMLLRFDEKL